MVPLDRSDYARVRPVFEGLRYNLVVDSVLDGNTPGWVYGSNTPRRRAPPPDRLDVGYDGHRG